jgi:hypothetical protein
MKITVGQLRRIIREEVEQEKVRKIVKEAVKSELNEGLWSNLKDLASVTFKGEVDGLKIPPGVQKGDWTSIVNQARKASEERKMSYIASAAARAKEAPGRGVITYKGWLEKVESEEEDMAAMDAAVKKAAENAAIKRQHELEDFERYQRAKSQQARSRKEIEDKEEAEKKAKDKEEEDRLLRRGKAPYNPSGSSSMGKASDAW